VLKKVQKINAEDRQTDILPVCLPNFVFSVCVYDIKLTVILLLSKKSDVAGEATSVGKAQATN
jgi:hypothetical protein